ncbi:MAG: sugar phosphate isomerase/epimerase family protein [Candidatus Zipacnadales bacterium]
MNRRRFVETLVALRALSVTAAKAQAEGQKMARDGVQLYWFSQLVAKEGKSFDKTLPQTLATVAEAGFANIETSLSYCATDEAAAAFVDKLKTAGVGLSALYSGGALHDEGATQTVRAILDQAARAKQIGCPGINCNPDPIGREKTNAELANQAAALNDIGAGLTELDLWFGIHTHAPEMSHNAREFRHNLERTDPQYVGLCADFHWMYRGGGDPYALTEQYAERIVSTHLRNSIEAVWAEAFGEGDLDYVRLAGILDRARYEGPLVVEIAWEARTPHTRSPLENLRLSRQYLREVFGI